MIEQPTPELIEDNGWRAFARCAEGDVDPEIYFHPHTPESRELASTICRQCVVRDHCLEESLTYPTDDDNIYAGKTRAQRIDIRFERRNGYRRPRTVSQRRRVKEMQNDG